MDYCMLHTLPGYAAATATSGRGHIHTYNNAHAGYSITISHQNRHSKQVIIQSQLYNYIYWLYTSLYNVFGKYQNSLVGIPFAWNSTVGIATSTPSRHAPTFDVYTLFSDSLYGPSQSPAFLWHISIVQNSCPGRVPHYPFRCRQQGLLSAAYFWLYSALSFTWYGW